MMFFAVIATLFSVVRAQSDLLGTWAISEHYSTGNSTECATKSGITLTVTSEKWIRKDDTGAGPLENKDLFESDGRYTISDVLATPIPYVKLKVLMNYENEKVVCGHYYFPNKGEFVIQLNATDPTVCPNREEAFLGKCARYEYITGKLLKNDSASIRTGTTIGSEAASDSSFMLHFQLGLLLILLLSF